MGKGGQSNERPNQVDRQLRWWHVVGTLVMIVLLIYASAAFVRWFYRDAEGPDSYISDEGGATAAALGVFVVVDPIGVCADHPMRVLAIDEISNPLAETT